MGSLVSELFAKFKLRPMTKILFDTFDEKQTFSIRYVEYNFILWDHIRLAVDNFTLSINNLNSNIKIIFEIQEDSSFPFLYVHLHDNNRKLSHNVY